MDMFYVNLLFCLYHRSAWHLIQPKEYRPTVPCLTHTSTTWRGARKTWIPTCRPARTAQKWIQPELPGADHPENLLGSWWVPWVSPAELLRITGWRPSSCRLLDGLCFSEETASFTVLKSMQEWLQLYVHSFVCLSVCFKNLEKFQKRSCWPIVLPFHFSDLECCQCEVSNPGTAELWCNVPAGAGAWFGTFEWVYVCVHVCMCVCVILDLLKSVTFCKQQE